MNIDIRYTSAVGDGKTMNTKIIQRMINECSAAGVHFKNTTFSCGKQYP